jgi:hypothetical protein
MFAIKVTKDNFNTLRINERIHVNKEYYRIIGRTEKGELRLVQQNVEREVIKEMVLAFADIFKNEK